MEHTLGGSTAMRSVDAGRGLGWWTDAWALFMKNAGLWIVMGLAMAVACIVLALIPLLGQLALALLAPVLCAGWMVAARKAAGGGAVDITDLVMPFTSDRLVPLVIIGALLLAVSVVIGLLAFVFGVGAAIGVGAGASAGSAGGAMAAAGMGFVMMLLCLAIGVVVAMGFWFAPALVMLQGMAPMDAVKASFAGSLKNIVPFLLYGVIYFVAAIVASIPFGLGWLVLVPLLLLTMYCSYRDVFGG